MGGSSAKDWAEESYRAAKANACTIGSPAGCTNDSAPFVLSPDYQSRTLDVAQSQIEKAGVRLAWVLNMAAAQMAKAGS